MARIALALLAIATPGAGVRDGGLPVEHNPFVGWEEEEADDRHDLNLMDWFLTPDEITAARGGIPRTQLNLYTENNIQFLVNDHAFRRLFKLIEATQKGDFIYASWWDVELDMMLAPDENDLLASKRSTLIETLKRARKRGVDIRVLLDFGAKASARHGPICERMNKELHQKAACVLDNRHSAETTGSNHLKTWSIRIAGSLVTLVGSLDIARGRFDLSTHPGRKHPRVRMQPKDWVRRSGWRENMYEVIGGAGEDVLAFFVARWNDPVKPKFCEEPLDRLPEVGMLLVDDGRVGVPAEELPEVMRPQDRRFVPTQVTITIGCGATNPDFLLSPRVPFFQDFAPRGEYTVAAAWFKALRNARRYIYVADQFMSFPEAIEAVLEAAQHVDFVFMVMNAQSQHMHLTDTFHFSIDFLKKSMQDHMHKAIIEPLQRRKMEHLLGRKIFLFNLVKDGTTEIKPHRHIYNHEKTMIIDDVFAFIGTAGFDRAAFTSDTDLMLSVLDEAWVTDLRKKIWGEFLMLEPNDARLATPEAGKREWLAQAEAGNRVVRKFKPKQYSGTPWNKPYKALTDFFYNLIEPEGRCEGKEFEDMWPGNWVEGKINGPAARAEAGPAADEAADEVVDGARKAWV